MQEPAQTVTTNDEQRLFVIPARDGYSCFGYDNCYAECRQLAEALGRPDLAPREEDVGTLPQYELYRRLCGLAAHKDLGTWFNPGTDPAVKRVLEAYRRSGARIRITLGDRETGRQWGDGPETGAIGRSTGPLKAPLLLRTRRSTGGEAILTACIVRLEDAATGRDLYRHPGFHVADERDATAPGP
jgi:hypothetical protein